MDDCNFSATINTLPRSLGWIEFTIAVQMCALWVQNLSISAEQKHLFVSGTIVHLMAKEQTEFVWNLRSL